MTNFQVVSRHAEVLASGLSVAPGDEVSLDNKEAKEPHNARLIEEGVLVKSEEKKEGD